jgi:hypothetical protein
MTEIGEEDPIVLLKTSWKVYRVDGVNPVIVGLKTEYGNDRCTNPYERSAAL